MAQAKNPRLILEFHEERKEVRLIEGRKIIAVMPNACSFAGMKTEVIEYIENSDGFELTEFDESDADYLREYIVEYSNQYDIFDETEEEKVLMSAKVYRLLQNGKYKEAREVLKENYDLLHYLEARTEVLPRLMYEA